MAHKDVHHDSIWVPVVSCDYLFVSARGVFRKNEWEPLEGEAHMKVLVIYDSSSKAIFAHAVPQKGVDPDGFVIDRLKEDIAWLGHASVVIRRDNEPSLALVVDNAIRALKASEGVNASWEGSVPYDPQTNGYAEGAVRRLKGMFRTLLLGLEK